MYVLAAVGEACIASHSFPDAPPRAHPECGNPLEGCEPGEERKPAAGDCYFPYLGL